MVYCVSLIFKVLTLMIKLYICGTPSSRKFKRLPDSSLAKAASGFAYHSQTHDYKVVKLWFSSHVNIFENIIPPLEAEVYPLSLDSWRRVETSLRPKVGVYDSNINAILGATFVSRPMHWLVYCREFEDKQSILTFDLNNEKFRRIYSLMLVQIDCKSKV